MKKIMIYCQHLAGMGHLVRCREIIRELVKDFQVCFISGGQIVPEFQLPSETEIVQLPGLWQRGAELVPVDESQSLETIMEQRQQQLLAVFDQFQPDCLMTECFPFSKMSMKSELSPVLKYAQASRHPVRIVCSLRDLIMTQPLSAGARERREAKVCRLINRFYDAVLYHTDPSLYRLEECFPRVDDLHCDLIYTGYVAQALSPETVPTPEDLDHLSNPAPMIVASAGGGRHGYPLLSTLLAAAPSLAQQIAHQIYVFAGPFMPDEEFLALQREATGQPNVILHRYTPVLLNYLQKADLSISLGGYNTTMNILRTGVRSLLLPSPNLSQADEQRLRAEKLASLGVLQLLKPPELTPERLTQAVLHRLQSTPNTHPIDLQGARNTAQYLKRLLAKQPALAEVA
jgi:predicted glycosyltransferase